MKIERKRWVIMRNNRTEIFCGLARHYELSGFKSSWRRIEFDFEAVAVNEVIETVGQGE